MNRWNNKQEDGKINIHTKMWMAQVWKDRFKLYVKRNILPNNKYQNAFIQEIKLKAELRSQIRRLKEKYRHWFSWFLTARLKLTRIVLIRCGQHLNISWSILDFKAYTVSFICHVGQERFLFFSPEILFCLSPWQARKDMIFLDSVNQPAGWQPSKFSCICHCNRHSPFSCLFGCLFIWFLL